MIRITKNQFTFWTRVTFTVPLIWLFVKFCEILFGGGLENFHLLSLFAVMTFYIILLSFVVVGLLMKPISLKVNQNELQFYTYSIVSGNSKYSIYDVKGFSQTRRRTQAKVKVYSGIILYLKDNSKVELTEFNLQSLTPFMKFLQDENVNCFGEETSWFPFRPIRFRYDK